MAVVRYEYAEEVEAIRRATPGYHPLATSLILACEFFQKTQQDGARFP